jgi:hypothetical protein
MSIESAFSKMSFDAWAKFAMSFPPIAKAEFENLDPRQTERLIAFFRAGFEEGMIVGAKVVASARNQP